MIFPQINHFLSNLAYSVPPLPLSNHSLPTAIALEYICITSYSLNNIFMQNARNNHFVASYKIKFDINNFQAERTFLENSTTIWFVFGIPP